MEWLQIIKDLAETVVLSLTAYTLIKKILKKKRK